MTTTVTVKTHDWPVAVTITDLQENGMQQSREEVGPDSEQSFYITQTRSLRFNELPLQAVVEEPAEVAEVAEPAEQADVGRINDPI